MGEKNRHLPTLRGAGGLTVDNRSTCLVAMKFFGYNGSNKLSERSMASKLRPQLADKEFHQSEIETREKRKLLTFLAVAKNFIVIFLKKVLASAAVSIFVVILYLLTRQIQYLSS